MTAPKILIHVQHLLGIGHLQRATAIAGALSEAGAQVVLASGGMSVPHVERAVVARGVTFVQLAAARTADVAFSKVLDANGVVIDDAWRERRRAALLGLFAELEPDAVITEMYPFGRRPFRFELLPLLEAARARPRPALTVSSVRDILVEKGKAGRAEESADIARRLYDLVLVHADPRLVRFDTSFAPAGTIADRMRYTGYITSARVATGDTDRSQGEILVSVGGGAVGYPLVAAAIEARPLSKERNRPWRILAGANLPQPDFETFAARSAGQAGLTLERFRPDFTELLTRCRVSVSQGGYNTLLEVLASRSPAVVAPFAEAEETEQFDRTRMLDGMGLLRLIPPAELTPARLAAEIDRATKMKPAEVTVDLNGAVKSAVMVLEAIRARNAAETPSR